MDETWKIVPEYPEYEASSLGNVRSKYTRRPLVGRINQDGYRSMIVCSGGKRYGRKFAYMVATAFHGPRPSGAVICHKNGIESDDRPENLRYATQKDNIWDKARHGTWQCCDKHAMRKIGPFRAALIRQCRCVNTRKILTKIFGLSQGQIDNIKTGRSWRGIPTAAICVCFSLCSCCSAPQHYQPWQPTLAALSSRLAQTETQLSLLSKDTHDDNQRLVNMEQTAQTALATANASRQIASDAMAYTKPKETITDKVEDKAGIGSALAIIAAVAVQQWKKRRRKQETS